MPSTLKSRKAIARPTLKEVQKEQARRADKTSDEKMIEMIKCLQNLDSYEEACVSNSGS